MFTRDEEKVDKSLAGFLRKERTSIIGAFATVVVLAFIQPHRPFGFTSTILAAATIVGVFSAAWYALVYRKTGLSQQELSNRRMR